MTIEDSPAILINDTRHSVLCGFCDAPIAFRGEPDGDGTDVGCTDCGNFADIDEAASIAMQFAQDALQLQINTLARDAARKSKVMTFSGKTAHNKTYRFTVDL